MCRKDGLAFTPALITVIGSRKGFLPSLFARILHWFLILGTILHSIKLQSEMLTLPLRPYILIIILNLVVIQKVDFNFCNTNKHSD